MDAPDHWIAAAGAVGAGAGLIVGLVWLVCGAIRAGRGKRLRP